LIWTLDSACSSDDLPVFGGPTNRDLSRALASHRDRIAMDHARADARLVELSFHPLAQVGVRTVLVVRQLGEGGTQHANALGALRADESSLDHLLERAMRHWHRVTFLSNQAGRCASTGRRGRGSRPVPLLPRTL